MTFLKLVRYQVDGQSYYGDLMESNKEGHSIKKLQGSLTKGFKETDEINTVQKVRNLHYLLHTARKADSAEPSYFALWKEHPSSFASD